MGVIDLSSYVWPGISQGRDPQIPAGTNIRGGATIWTALDPTPTNGGQGIISSIGKAITFNGSSNTVKAPGRADATGDGGVTMLLYVRFNTAVAGILIKQALSRANGTGQAIMLMAHDHTAAAYRDAWAVNRNNTWTPCQYSSALPVGSWLVLSASAANGQLKIYKGGRLDNTASYTGSLTGATNTLFVGSGTGDGVSASVFCDCDIALAAEIAGSRDGAWHAAVGENPWLVMDLPPLFFPSAPAGGTLSGNAQAIASASGSLSTSLPLAGAAVGIITATGAISTALPLAGAAAAVSSAGGTLTLGIALSGSALATAVASGPLATAMPLAGNAQATATATGNLTAASASALAGNAQAIAAATGAMLVQFSISGAAVAQAAATGNLTASGTTALAGNAAVQAVATGALSSAIPLAGDAQVTASASGNLTKDVPLTGAAVVVGSANGNLLVTINLSGAAVAQAIATGGLRLSVPLSGAAVVQAVASGYLQGSGTLVNDARFTVARPARRFTVARPARRFTVARPARRFTVALTRHL